MAIALDATGSGAATTSPSSLTFSHTCTGSNLVLVVFAVSNNNTNGFAETPTGITYNSVALTEVTGSAAETANAHGSWWYLLNPSTGANNVVITYAESQDQIIGISHSYTGAKQSGQPDASAHATHSSGSTTSSTITTVADNAMIVSACFERSNFANITSQSPLTDQIHRYDYSTLYAASADYLLAAHGAQTAAWTVDQFSNSGVCDISLSPSTVVIAPEICVLGAMIY